MRRARHLLTASLAFLFLLLAELVIGMTVAGLIIFWLTPNTTWSGDGATLGRTMRVHGPLTIAALIALMAACARVAWRWSARRQGSRAPHQS